MTSRAIRRMTITFLAILMSATLGVGATQSAFAASSAPSPQPSPASLNTLKLRCENAISRRLTFLGDLQGRVNSASVLSAQHKSALLQIIGGDHSGLTALDTKIESETSPSQLRADCRDIVTGYRVYVLVGPQAHLTIAADRVDFVDTKLQGLYGRLSAALQRCSASPAQCQAAEQAFDDLQSKVRQSSQAVAGVASEVLALQPAGYPANEPTLDAARTSVETAHAALLGARRDIAIIRRALRPSSAVTPAPATPAPRPATPTPGA